ncbi:MFS transporter [Isoptericola sp. b408]|uniref:MFS transporter n=1 Tax=Isoptericola sp. b408 TaxID=3064653 RepID=UPI0027127334|nr:MFS transporter [Isoptericola sp. b408]MDO8150741.1 MFS transporter [Isoptericola sp. b408]
MTTLADPTSGHPPRSLLANRSYLLVMSGLTAQAFGAGMAAFAVPLLAYAVTGSVWQAGVISAVGHAGALLATLPAGVVADRVDRRRLVVVAATVAALAWASGAVAVLAGTLGAWHLMALLLVSSVAGSFVDPAVAGAFRSVVPQDQLATAYAAAQGRDAAAGLAAGPIGGLLYGIAHAVPLVAGAVGHLMTALCTWLVREPLHADLAEARGTRPLAALREGLRYVWSVPLFRICLGLFAVINVAINALLVAITLDLTAAGTPAAQIGLLSGTAGASMLVGALLAPAVVARVRVGVVTPLSLAMVAVSAVVMAATQDFVVLVVALGLGVLGVPAANAGLAGYVAAITPPQMQGRLSSVLELSGVVALPSAPLVGAGLLASAGLPTTLVVLAGVLGVAVVGVWCARPVRRIGLPASWADDAIEVVRPPLGHGAGAPGPTEA